MLMKNKFSKFINLQGKYLTSLLILLALSIGQMWGADVTVQVGNAGSTAGNSVDLTSSAGKLSDGITSRRLFVMSAGSTYTGTDIQNSTGIDVLYGNESSTSTRMGSTSNLGPKLESGLKGHVQVGVEEGDEVIIYWFHSSTFSSKTMTVSKEDPSDATKGVKVVDVTGVNLGTSKRTGSTSWTSTINGTAYFSFNTTLYVYAVKIIPKPSSTKHTVTYDLNGATGTTPTQADVAEGAKFTLHNGTTGITAPAGQKFDGWHDGTTKYAGGAEYTMGTSNVTLTAQWVDDLPDPTATFTGATYIIGSGTLNMSANFESNSTGAVTYTLKEASANASITEAGVFSATAAGEYVVVANQVATATYSAISKEATVTVLDNELSDTYVWKKGAGYTGCVANPNADAPAAQYTDIAYEGFTGMGRAAADNTECILTFTVKAAYSATFGIKSICTYGKLEEPLGGQISWDGGANWEDLAAYAEGKKEFNAPSATFPTSFKIRFLGVSASSGGLYWRNALVTLAVKKTVTGVTEALVGAEINGEAISAANLAALLEDKTLDIATSYATAPTVTFVKQVTTTYSGGWSPDVEDVDVEVAASDNTTAWQASATINAQAYTINIAKPAGPSLETEATAFTLTSAKIATDTKSFTFSGVNLTSGNVTVSLESPVAGMTVSPAEVTPTAGAITDQEVTITYKSLEAVAEANVNLVVYYDADTKITIPLTYSSTAGYEDLTSISAATTWNWDGAASAAYGTLGQNEMIILANADVTWDEGFNARAIAGKLQHYYRDSKYAQGNELKFNTTIPGKVYVTYSNTGGNDPRTVNVNGTKGSLSSSNNKDADKRTEAFLVSAGDVLIKGVLVSDDSNQMLRYYEVRFAPVFAVTYGAGEGSVKGGETMPTQADEAAGEKITLAAATALEKDGYDFAGWLCDIDAQTYQPGDEYTMTAAATTFTAQWVLHVDPVDPTLTYDEGAYTIGLAALDLSTLITAKTSTGAITYSVKEAGTTGAAIDGNNFTATAAGTATITASQAAVLGYNAITVDFDVVVTEATEIDGIKMVENNALTGNFRTSLELTDCNYTIAGLNYTKYVKLGSSVDSWSSVSTSTPNKYLVYSAKTSKTTFSFYVHNNASSTPYNILLYVIAEGDASATRIPIEVAGGANVLKSYELETTTNTEVYITASSTNIYFCQVVAQESGTAHKQAPDVGYSINLNKGRLAAASATEVTLDGMTYVLSSGYGILNNSEAKISAKGEQYISFTIPTGETRKLQLTTSNTNKYTVSKTKGDDANQITPEANVAKEFNLTEGTWFINPQGSNVQVTNIAFAAAPTYAVTYSAGAGSVKDGESLPTQPAIFEGSTFNLASGAALEKSDYDFAGWLCNIDGQTYDAGDEYTMTAAATTFTAQWEVHVDKFSVTYNLNGGSGTTPTQADQAAGATFTLHDGVTGITAPLAKEFSKWKDQDDNEYAGSASFTMPNPGKAVTLTAQWVDAPELTDTYIWKKGTGYTGCVADPNVAANVDETPKAMTYSSLTTVGFATDVYMGRSDVAGNEVMLTFTATQTGYAIKSICTYGKLEENDGAQISWDNGSTWTSLAKYGTEAVKTFDAPLGDFPTTFKIKFISASTSTGGLWWRNALVTLEKTKTVASTEVTLQNVKVNGSNIAAADLTTLQSSHSLDIATPEYVSAPEVTFVKRVTKNFTDASSAFADVEIPVTATVDADKWKVTETINSIEYTVTLAKPAGAALSTSVTELTLTSAKAATDSKSFTFSGDNLGTTNITIALESAVAGLSVSPAVVSPVAGVITDQEVVVTYQSFDDVAATDVNLIVRYSDDVKKTIVLHYSSTAGIGTLTDVTGDMTWDFSKAAPSANVAISNTEITILANYDVENDLATIKTDNIEVKGERVTKTKDIRVNYLHFHTTVAGLLTLQYSNTGGNSARGIYVNGKLYDAEGSANTTKKGLDNVVYVPAGDVVLEAKELSTGDVKNVQLYQMIFIAKATPDYVRDDSWMAPGELGTICYPEGLVAVGANMYQMAGTDENGKFVFDEVSVLEPGVPYLFEATANAIHFYATNAAAASEAGTSNGMVGTFEVKVITAGTPNIYYFSGQKFYSVAKRSTDLTVPANRAYVDLTTPQPAAAPVPGRRRISFGVEGETVATALDNLNAGDKPVKVMIDGQLFIIRGEKMFDATGRLVK